MYWEHINKKNWTEGNCINARVSEESFTHPRIYIDMDGTLAQWNHEKSEEHPDGVTMEMVNSPGYFRTLKPNTGVVEFTKTLILRGYDVRILSKSSYGAIKEKTEWLGEYLPEIKKEKIYFVPLNAEKSDFIPNPVSMDILIDDYNPNLDSFKGTAVKCVTDRNSINPAYPWINNDNPVYKNLNVITWVLLREWIAAKQAYDNTVADNCAGYDIKILEDIRNKSVMSSVDFMSMCEGFSFTYTQKAYEKTGLTPPSHQDIEIEI